MKQRGGEEDGEEMEEPGWSGSEGELTIQLPG